MQELRDLQDFVNLSNQSNSNTDKKQAIEYYASNENVKSLLRYTYDTFKQYGVSSANCKKNSDLLGHSNTYGSIFTLLDDLADRVCTGHTAIANVNRFILENRQYEDLIWNIIDRNLKTRSTISMINKVIPGLIPTFDVALASKYEPKNCDFENEEWLASRKLDGVRCIIRKEGNKINAFSRAGKEFLTLQKVLDDVSKISGNFILDGEICMMDSYGNEDFQGIMKEIKKKDHTIANPKFVIFDYLTLEEFDSKKGEQNLGWRIKMAHEKCWGVDSTLEVLLQKKVNDVEHLSELISDADKNGYEGVMLRKNTGYEGKRSKNLLKCKKFHDAEYKVIDIEHDFNRVIVDGEEVEEMMLRNVVIEHKGNRVSVGSGFSHEQKRKYHANPENIMGKIITVQYFEETTNQNGTQSLRFPTVKHVFENGRNV
jgi:DNA ligase 1